MKSYSNFTKLIFLNFFVLQAFGVSSTNQLISKKRNGILCTSTKREDGKKKKSFIYIRNHTQKSGSSSDVLNFDGAAPKEINEADIATYFPSIVLESNGFFSIRFHTDYELASRTYPLKIEHPKHGGLSLLQNSSPPEDYNFRLREIQLKDGVIIEKELDKGSVLSAITHRGRGDIFMETKDNLISFPNGKEIKGENVGINMQSCFSVPDDIDLAVLSNILKYKAPWECSLRNVRKSDQVKSFKKYVKPNWFYQVVYENLHKSKDYDLGIHRQLTGYELQKCAAIYKDLDEENILVINNEDRRINNQSRNAVKDKQENPTFEKSQKGNSAVLER